MIKAGIIGGAGYTAGELIRLLLHHTSVEIDFVYSSSQAGHKLSKVHQDLFGQTGLSFCGEVNPDVDVVFLCLGHGHSKEFLSTNEWSSQTKIIDLSKDFRLQEDQLWKGHQFVYGLPELHKAHIAKAQLLANPGCFATAIQLALLPLAEHALLQDDVHINAVTGATGAGRSLSESTHFTWRDNNFSHYKAFTHQHLDEITASVEHLQPGYAHRLHFIPNRGNFSRGIFATAYTGFQGDLQMAFEMYSSFYKDSPFTHVSAAPIHLKQVVNTNNCVLHLMLHERQLLVTSVIDNLLKGASGQAVQNMNLMFGLEEKEGLSLKATYF
jgi:N-acetyl-gamma-glutamyl-phosphate reductase